MKRSLASILLVLFTIASVATISSRRAQAQTEVIVFSAFLLVSNEVPPISNIADIGASGSGIFTLTVTRTGTTITAATARFDTAVNGVGASLIVATHVHEGAAGIAGPVRVDSGITVAPFIPVVGGSAQFTRSGITVTPAIAQAIIDNPAGWYFNVHSSLNQGGVVRGQLVRAAATPQPSSAPTLSEWGMILMSLLFVAAGTFFLVGRKRVVTATGGADHSMAFDSPMKSLDFKALARVTLYVEVLAGLALIAIRPGIVDVVGALVSGLLVAFTVSLFISSSKRG